MPDPVPHGKLPLLLFAAGPAHGHVNPLLRVSSAMIERGYEVAFFSSVEFKDKIIKTGAEWLEITPYDFSKASPQTFAGLKLPIQRIAWAFENVFIPCIPMRTKQVRNSLENIRRRDPNRQVIILHELGAMAVHPFFFGAPLPEGYTSFPKTICLGINPIMFDNPVTGLAGPGLPFEYSPAVRARNEYILELNHTFIYKSIREAHERNLKEAGCQSTPDRFQLQDLCLTSDAFLQLCGPSFEYPNPELSPKIVFAGTLPRNSLASNFQHPSWWPNIVETRGNKKIVFLAQGTAGAEDGSFLTPVIRALEDLNDIILVVAIGKRDARLPDDFKVPANTKVIDYFPYDAILPHSDAFVFNGGYGGAGHAIANGVPLVVFGGRAMGADKPEVSARVEWSGLGVNIRSRVPSQEEIRVAVKTVLDNPRYKEKAIALQNESLDLDPFSCIERQIQKLTV